MICPPEQSPSFIVNRGRSLFCAKAKSFRVLKGDFQLKNIGGRRLFFLEKREISADTSACWSRRFEVVYDKFFGNRVGKRFNPAMFVLWKQSP